LRKRVLPKRREFLRKGKKLKEVNSKGRPPS